MAAGPADLTPKISVCIANFNGIDMLDACIQSVIEQEIDQQIEILVHDDASNDGSARLVRSRYPDAHLIESRTNVGFCIANNRMAAAARGDYLLLLNNDAELLPGALAALYAEAVAREDSAILTLPQYRFDNGELIDRGCLLDPFFNPVPNTTPDRQDVAMVMGACFWIPRDLWLQLGGFPEWFESIAEDMYLCCRARLAGHAVKALGVSGYRHRIGASFGGGKTQHGRLATTVRRRALSERNKTLVLLTCQPLALLLVTLPVHLLLLQLEGVAILLVTRRVETWRDVYLHLMPRLWTLSSPLWSARREIQAHRTTNLAQWLSCFTGLPWKLHLLLRHGPPTLD